jgi:dolichol-phosphate mannosyltransferase
MTASWHKQAQPRLSFIIPAYNEEALLADTVQQLHRVLAQLQQPSEIVIVNDGSVDRTGSIADTLSASLDQVRTVHQTNQGIGGAFRAGASRAAGDYLMLWPADMRPEAPDLTPYLSALGQAVREGELRRAFGRPAG